MDSSKPKRRVVKMPVEVVEVKPKKRVVKMPVEEVVEVKPKKRVVKMPVEVVKPKKRVIMPVEEKQIVFPIYEATLMTEGDEEPIVVKKVHNVTLEILNHNDMKYYLDASRNKVYERLGDKKHGKYLGRWDSNSEQIISTVDSDCEE